MICMYAYTNACMYLCIYVCVSVCNVCEWVCVWGGMTAEDGGREAKPNALPGCSLAHRCLFCTCFTMGGYLRESFETSRSRDRSPTQGGGTQ